MSLELRPARPTDAGTIGDILHRFAAETPWMPELYSGAEAISFCGVMIDRGWVTVAEEGVRVLGFLARDGAEICALYLAPEARGQGIGKRLLDAAKGTSGHLHLWTFEANSGAQRFYLREGFTETARSDGARNDEGLPDISYAWQAAKQEAA
ncbi:GNAT family N-acetyltransferase [Phaeobacter gallaeciensis]|uniref:GNAT family N-acetyltransferase n=1 Tax=Phaeobacter gallaeciensis TaxID=60890 RepID=UPI00237FB54B|nr:GNAT family N-acetyltransferase [Phaeobacter gallaeciensis]MDE4097030.1 GNAT family N-acetyltransferase [Phaeobacter gallaeciensis]MDE4105676.1 GNAT family N-acetyltransferase [Phaeobacter gallaeciensis]MDE4110297.1 GNAT family N-acetyltransferase [Phaeobacter gallaeciensis]MDE4114765.1 GNAT family N-acetyltransferase [Phaeobacter gallaeciensis]MDE4119068.1 GNAT family N-acetyltransferase [Phaeobacter gallaeciensis]